MNENIEKLRAKAANLPLLPGCYIMKDDRQQVIYVGKAKALKNRVSSYFRGAHLPKVEAMVQKVCDFDIVVASSEFEALVLENSLIKQHMPYYNILLRDDKGYPFIRLDYNSRYPRFSVVGRVSDDGAKYFGPFGSRGVSFEVIDTLCKTLMLPTCNRVFPRDIGKNRPCLNLHMGTCKGYCKSDTDHSDYREKIDAAVMVLTGKTEALIAELEAGMQAAAEEMKYELAASFRDRIRAVRSLENKQRVIATAFADTDIIGFFRGERTCFAVLHYKDGAFAGKDFEIIDDPLEEDGEAVSKFISQYYGYRGTAARSILVSTELEDAQSLGELISSVSGHKVEVLTPKRGDKRALCDTADTNAREEVQRAATVKERTVKVLGLLAKVLELDAPPQRIEAFDISNTGSFGIVGAMTVFEGGRPLKRDYKRFKVRSTETQDDYASMFEVVYRRYSHCAAGDEGFELVPDLILIDGGQAHTQVALNALSELGLVLPVFGMVKDDRHRTRALITAEGREIGISTNQALFSFIGRIQEETHRYAIEYHRSLRSRTINSGLDKIDGIGMKRRNDLLKHFKTISAIKLASLEELEAVVPKNAARAVYDYYHPQE